MSASLETALTNARAWLESDPDFETQNELSALLSKADAGDMAASAVLNQRFKGRLEFGTAGIRGPLGFGPQAMNRVVVSQTTAGLAKYLISQVACETRKLRVLVVYDARKNSSVFARGTAEVLSGHGIDVLLSPNRVPTPIVAFGVRRLRCDAGVMVTASHNSARDNGYKVYFGGDDQGSQIVPPVDQRIEQRISLVADTLRFDEIPRSTDRVSSTPPSLVNDYLRDTVTTVALAPAGQRPLSVVYTPMHGVGGISFSKSSNPPVFRLLRWSNSSFNPTLASRPSPSPILKNEEHLT